MSSDEVAEDEVDTYVEFNRSYLEALDLLRRRLPDSALPVAEARALFFIVEHDGLFAANLAELLEVDEAATSRTLRRLERRGLIRRGHVAHDGRLRTLSATAEGHAAAAALEENLRGWARLRLGFMESERRPAVVEAMRTIMRRREPRPDGIEVVTRDIGVGDLGWIVEHHARCYAQDLGWDSRFESHVAREVAAFDPARDRGWIVERFGTRFASVVCMHENARVAQLRLLLVEPRSRRRGTGHRLVAECVRHATARGYRKLRAWANATHPSARHIFETFGFSVVRQKELALFGARFDAELWERPLVQLDEAAVLALCG